VYFPGVSKIEYSAILLAREPNLGLSFNVMVEKGSMSPEASVTLP